MARLAIFDYGAGNIFSLKNAFEKLGASVDVITGFEKPNTYSGILLPGVGNFDPAIDKIASHSKSEFRDYVKDTPVLGICLGMEMYFDKSEEGVKDGLGIIDGKVVVLPSTMKVPHMGWNSLEIKKQTKFLENIDDGAWVYFVHSYMAKPNSADVVVAESDYGIKIPAIIEKDNFFGTQFHPEKSGKIGKTMLENFLKECTR